MLPVFGLLRLHRYFLEDTGSMLDALGQNKTHLGLGRDCRKEKEVTVTSTLIHLYIVSVHLIFVTFFVPRFAFQTPHHLVTEECELQEQTSWSISNGARQKG